MNLKDAIFAVIDTETTGLDPKEDRVVELACIHVRVGDGLLDRWSSLVNPVRPIPAEASAIHHLVDVDVVDAPILTEAQQRLWTEPFQAFAAHNAAFDFGFIDPSDAPVLCTMRLARKLWPDLPQAGNQFLRYHFRLNIPEAHGLAAHRAEVDALVTAHLLLFELDEILRRAKEPDAVTVEGLVTWVAEPMLQRVCRFGKHKGLPWAEVPRDYLKWALAKLPDMDLDTRFTLEHWAGRA
jgi:exodeoxyribonuclease X